MSELYDQDPPIEIVDEPGAAARPLTAGQKAAQTARLNKQWRGMLQQMQQRVYMTCLQLDVVADAIERGTLTPGEGAAQIRLFGSQLGAAVQRGERGV